MSDYIKRDDVLTVLRTFKETLITECTDDIRRDLAQCAGQALDGAASCVKVIPAADVAPVVRGKWEADRNRPGRYVCSECGLDMTLVLYEGGPYNFCPRCGADMREVAQDG